jgi:hypothetical protein
MATATRTTKSITNEFQKYKVYLSKCYLNIQIFITFFLFIFSVLIDIYLKISFFLLFVSVEVSYINTFICIDKVVM